MLRCRHSAIHHPVLYSCVRCGLLVAQPYWRIYASPPKRTDRDLDARTTAVYCNHRTDDTWDSATSALVRNYSNLSCTGTIRGKQHVFMLSIRRLEASACIDYRLPSRGFSEVERAATFRARGGTYTVTLRSTCCAQN